MYTASFQPLIAKLQ